jgi:hypothetical protein
LRYFVVHNFVLNFDSYTGSMMHNYYLYEDDGMLSMIAWDYNLAFGGFGMGRAGSSATDTATAMVNYPIDTPVSGATLEDRPLLGQLLSDDTYLALYHQLFGEFLALYFDTGAFDQVIDNAVNLISPYVEKDPSAFCTYNEFLDASASLREFVQLRAQSVQGQLDGIIPATSKGQAADNSAFIDASHINIQGMGSQAGSFGGARQQGAITPRDNSGNMYAPVFGAAQAAEEPADRPDPDSFSQGGDVRNRQPPGDAAFAGSDNQAAEPDFPATLWTLSTALILLAAGILIAKFTKNPR